MNFNLCIKISYLATLIDIKIIFVGLHDRLCLGHSIFTISPQILKLTFKKDFYSMKYILLESTKYLHTQYVHGLLIDKTEAERVKLKYMDGLGLDISVKTCSKRGITL